MTTEFVLLLGLFAFITMGALMGKNGPGAAFQKSGPRLGARLEQQLSTGRGFKVGQGAVLNWTKPSGNAPDGTL
jgi:hypothetical protein